MSYLLSNSGVDFLRIGYAQIFIHLTDTHISSVLCSVVRERLTVIRSN